MQVTYFGSDLTDPATVRRIHILRVAGADVNVIGYRRVPERLTEIEGCPVVDLGQVYDANFSQRMLCILRDSRKTHLLRKVVGNSDVLLGRNLEMATMALWAKTWAPSHAVLSYECLDVHRAFLGSGIMARMLRKWERFILRRASTLVVSSPGFITHYFRKLNVHLPPVVLAENKRVMQNAHMRRPRNGRLIGPPWRIGWFGKLRCVESFHMLYQVARRYPDLVDIQLRGQPIPEVRALLDSIQLLPNMRFDGPYKLDDLESMYAACHFTWGIEYYNRGTNSDWCLANRIYEGGFNNCPTIGLVGTEAAAWLKAHNAGVLLREPRIELEPLLVNMTIDQYQTMWDACKSISTNDLVWTSEECEDLLARISGTLCRRGHEA